MGELGEDEDDNAVNRDVVEDEDCVGEESEGKSEDKEIIFAVVADDERERENEAAIAGGDDGPSVGINQSEREKCYVEKNPGDKPSAVEAFKI